MSAQEWCGGRIAQRLFRGVRLSEEVGPIECELRENTGTRWHQGQAPASVRPRRAQERQLSAPARQARAKTGCFQSSPRCSSAGSGRTPSRLHQRRLGEGQPEGAQGRQSASAGSRSPVYSAASMSLRVPSNHGGAARHGGLFDRHTIHLGRRDSPRTLLATRLHWGVECGPASAWNRTSRLLHQWWGLRLSGRIGATRSPPGPGREVNCTKARATPQHPDMPRAGRQSDPIRWVGRLTGRQVDCAACCAEPSHGCLCRPESGAGSSAVLRGRRRGRHGGGEGVAAPGGPEREGRQAAVGGRREGRSRWLSTTIRLRTC